MECYRYPDDNDKILSSFVSQKEPYQGYWAESELNALKRVGDYLAEILVPRDRIRALDAGCGRGRAIPWIAKFASQIVAADPDPARLADARQVRPGDEYRRTQVEFHNVSVDKLRGEAFDLIVCNHVIQHVSTTAAQDILSSLKALATPKSVLILSFSRSAVGHEIYGISFLNDGVPEFEIIDRMAFDSLAASGGSKGYLPVRMIDPDKFANDARTVGWKIEWSWTYHAANWVDGETSFGSDNTINHVPALLRQCQGDIYVAMRSDDWFT